MREGGHSHLIVQLLKSSQNKKDLITSQLPRFFGVFFSAAISKKKKNGAAKTSLRSFFFRDDFTVCTR